ncbi:MAG: LPXTG cell wall anchor domain-containing protein [Nitrospirota bacterium]|nr:LPXTG cell wall anchor domain-containing protein [Nitrospirota bacterium]
MENFIILMIGIAIIAIGAAIYFKYKEKHP